MQLVPKLCLRPPMGEPRLRHIAHLPAAAFWRSNLREILSLSGAHESTTLPTKLEQCVRVVEGSSLCELMTYEGFDLASSQWYPCHLLCYPAWIARPCLRNGQRVGSKAAGLNVGKVASTNGHNAKGGRTRTTWGTNEGVAQ